ncbi:cyclic nucleotide-binding domain-containing protein, partial [Listeria monocytogenes]|nr:cyclic nucleotide-binding domain-containing protein [Listeria monocytogenes]
MAHHHHHSHIDCIRLVPIFNHLNEEQMSLIAQSAQEVHYAKNALLFGNGDKDDTLYIINNGRVRVYNLNESGREQTVRILNPGDFMGEVAIFQTESYHSNYAEAIS